MLYKFCINGSIEGGATGDELTSGRGFPTLGDAGEPFRVLDSICSEVCLGRIADASSLWAVWP